MVKKEVVDTVKEEETRMVKEKVVGDSEGEGGGGGDGEGWGGGGSA